MPSPPSHLFLPRNGGSDSIRSTVFLGFTAPFPAGVVVCMGHDGKLRQYGSCHPNDPIFGIVERLHPPFNTEVDVIISGIVSLDGLESGKTYYLADDGTLSKEGVIPIIQGMEMGKGIFTRPLANASYGMPTGTMIPTWANEVPAGWLECDGSLCKSKDYPALFAATFGNHGSILTKTVNGSETVLVLLYDGKIPSGTELLLVPHGKVRVLSHGQGILTVTSDKPFSPLQIAPASTQELSPMNLDEFFLPTKREPSFKWIIKT